MDSSVNAQNVKKAQAAVRKKMEEQKAAREKFAERHKDCLASARAAQATLDNAKSDYANSNAEELFEKERQVAEAQERKAALLAQQEQLERQVKKNMAVWNIEQKHATFLAREVADSWYSPFSPHKSDRDKQIAAADRARESYSRSKAELQGVKDEIGKLDVPELTGEELELLAMAHDAKDRMEDAQRRLDEINAECKRLMDEYNSLPNDFDEETLKKMEEVPAGRDGVSSIAGKRANRFGSSVAGSQKNTPPIESSKLFDVRNVNGKNFRGWAPDVLKGYSEAGIQLTPSRTFYMNQNYLFSDSLAKIGYDFQKFKSTPEIQPLIVNEFQPYQMLSIADLIPGMGDALAGVMASAAKLVGNTVVNIAKNAVHNNFLDRFSADPSQLYRQSYKREYFTSDPVTQVRNMFNGGVWLNTYELPFYGKDYLKASNSGKWKIGTVSDSLRKGLWPASPPPWA